MISARAIVKILQCFAYKQQSVLQSYPICFSVCFSFVCLVLCQFSCHFSQMRVFFLFVSYIDNDSCSFFYDDILRWLSQYHPMESARVPILHETKLLFRYFVVEVNTAGFFLFACVCFCVKESLLVNFFVLLQHLCCLLRYSRSKFLLFRYHRFV